MADRGDEGREGRRGRRAGRGPLARFAAAALAGAAIVAGAAAMLPVRYVAEAQLLSGGAGTLDAASAQVLTSRDFARRIASRLVLADRPEFVGGEQPVAELVGQTIGLLEDPLRTSPEERVLTAFQQRLAVAPVDGGIAIRFASSDARLARDGANALAEEFLALSRDRRPAPDDEAVRLAAEIARVDARLAELGGVHGRPDATLDRLRAELAEAEVAVTDAATRKDALDAIAGGRLLDPGLADEAGSPALAALAGRVADLGARLDALAVTLLPAHPEMKAVTAEFEAARTRVVAEARRLSALADRERSVRGAEAAALRQQIATLAETAARRDAGEIAEERGFQTALRDDLERRLAARRAAVVPQRPAEPIVVRATLPARPSGPSTLLLAGLGAALGGGIALAGLGLSAVRRRGVHRSALGEAPAAAVDLQLQPVAVIAERPETVAPVDEDAEEAATPAEPAAAPAGDAALVQDVANLPDSPAFTGLLRSLPVVEGGDAAAVPLDGLCATLLADGVSTIAVVSLVGRGGGVDRVAALLGDSAAEEGLRAIIVDTVHDEGGRVPGFAELLEGSAGFAEVITRHPHGRAHWIAAGGAPVADELFGSPLLATTLQALEFTYDLVLLDLGPLGDAPGRLGLVAAADHVVLIADLGDDGRAVAAALAGSGVAGLSLVSAREVAERLAA